MKNLIYKIIFSIFSLYWVMTLFFVAPDNYIKITFTEYESYFNLFFQQNWQFFAPPPNSNDRLMYTFINKKDSTDTKTFEVFEPLNIAKKENAPFNSAQNILDYVLSGNSSQVTSIIIDYNEAVLYQQRDSLGLNDNKSFILFTENQLTERKKIVQNSLPFKTLLNYGKLTALNNGIENLEDYYVKLELMDIPIRKFSNRNKEQKSIIYQISFMSDKLELAL